MVGNEPLRGSLVLSFRENYGDSKYMAIVIMFGTERLYKFKNIMCTKNRFAVTGRYAPASDFNIIRKVVSSFR